MKKLQWCAGIILGFSIIAALLITSFEIAMYSDFSVYQEEYEKWEEIMFKEKCRSISAFIRKCVNFYIKEKYDSKKI